MSRFENIIGPSEISADGYFSLGIGASDIRLLPANYRVLARASELSRKAEPQLPKTPWMVRFADSVYVESVHFPASRKRMGSCR